MHQMHRDIITELPPHSYRLGSTPQCLEHGFYIPGRVITVQGHPDFNEDIVRELLTLRRGNMGEVVYHDSWARAGLEHDGLRIIATFLKFFAGKIQ